MSSTTNTSVAPATVAEARYTMETTIGDLPSWKASIVYDTLAEYPVVCQPWGQGMVTVGGHDGAAVNEALRVAFAKVGRTVAEMTIDLF